jgi:hypothetical protein
MTEAPHGLPRRFAPRNDEVGGLACCVTPVQETKGRLFRHCEGRRPVAIQTAIQLALAFRTTEASHGLPRRFAPRNDVAGGLACCITPVQETKGRLFRHCEGRRPVAIQTALGTAPTFRKDQTPHGLPRRFAPRNDEVGDGTEVAPETRSRKQIFKYLCG